MNANSEPAEKQAGEIDLVRLFEAEAQDLLQAVERGRLLHKTKNIRDSGAPLEARFREVLRSRLPTKYRVLHGYLVDVESRCTPQIDVILGDAEEAHEFMVSSDGASYVPFTCAHAFFEVKNSGGSITSHLSQVSKIAESYRGMYSRLLSRGISALLPEVISVLVIGRSDDVNLKTLQDWYGSNEREAPTYLLLLDRGVIVARQSVMNSLLNDGPSELSFYEHRNAGEFYFYVPEEAEYRCGRALLWTYFSVLAHLNRNGGNKSQMLSFTNDAARRFKVVSEGGLHSARDLASWPTQK